ncbi:MAG: hypothetical protein QI223_00165 [Candidatus Korarchaeota archaeon]|nr:hypothetical protein [Candidatus Korarchaeota archaeon]
MPSLVRVVVLFTLLVGVSLASISPASASPDLYYDNFDAAQAKEYGDAWIDAVWMEVSGNETHLTVVIHTAAPVPTSSILRIDGPVAYLDTDGDGDDEYYVTLGIKGDGSVYTFRLCDTTVSPPACTNLPFDEILFQVGGDYVGFTIPYSDIGVAPGDQVGVSGHLGTRFIDTVLQEFDYTLGGGTAVSVDGDLSEWAGVPDNFDDGYDGEIPQEFDFRAFATVDNATAGTGQAISHRFTVEGGSPATSLSQGYMRISRLVYVYYDTDNDGTYDYEAWVAYYLIRSGASQQRYILYSLYQWNGASWSFLYSKSPSSWDWGPGFELSTPLADIGSPASGDTIGIKVQSVTFSDTSDPIPGSGATDFVYYALPAPGPAVGGELEFPLAAALSGVLAAVAAVALLIFSTRGRA